MIRLLSAWVLALTLALTGQVSALVRAMPDATGQMVLCIGGIAQARYTDANGNPTVAPHVCPDCLADQATALLTTNNKPFAAPRDAHASLIPAQRLSRQPWHDKRVRAPPFPA